MISSVRRRPRAAGASGPAGSTAGDGAVMLLTGLSPVRADHECPVEGGGVAVGAGRTLGAGGAVGTRLLAGMLKAEDGAHMAPCRWGCGPGEVMLRVGLWFRWA